MGTGTTRTRPSRRLSHASAVILSASRRRPRLSALHLKGTASLLRPEWQFLAPCLGAALMASPLAGNLTRLGQLVHPEAPNYYATASSSSSSSSSSPASLSMEIFQASRLASHLFFQLIRESPLHVTRTKSLPAAYLDPSLMGTLLGLSLLPDATTPQFLRNTLRTQHGIKSNYIHQTQWTGVSLTRWMDLIAFSSPASTTSPSVVSRNNNNNNIINNKKDISLVASLWLMALWELSNTKEDFLDFWMSIQQVLRLPNNTLDVLDLSNPLTQAVLHDSVARDEWANDQFDDTHDLSMDQVQAALDRLTVPSSSGQNGNNNNSNNIDSIEYSQALEVVCAAISLHHFPLNGKPPCPTGYYSFDGGGIQADCAEHTTREIINLLLWDESQNCFTVSRLPSSTSPRLVELYNETIHPFEESGNAWFELLSDIPGCTYLAKSPNGRRYELAPTVENILRAIQVLFFGSTTAAAAATTTTKTTTPWRTFEDLASAWTSNRLHVYESTLTHQSSKTGEYLHHEFVTLTIDDSSSGIELRLRYDSTQNSGMSKVTHMRERQPFLKDATQWQALLMNKEGPMTNKLLGLALGVEVSEVGSHSSTLEAAVMQMLATPFGCDRRSLLTLDMQESVRLAISKESEAVLKAALVQACALSHQDELLGATLLPWLLSESPTVFETTLPMMRKVDPEVEAAVSSLPQSLLGNNTIYDAVEDNTWALRGRPLAAWMRWRTGQSTATREASQLTIQDLLLFLSFCLTK